jgi:hypothetical protein
MARVQCGVKHAILMSSDGANAGSFLTYLSQKGEKTVIFCSVFVSQRTQKGQVEDEWKKLECDTLTILRPGVLDRGDQKNTMEKVMGVFMKPMPCSTVAQAIANRVRDLT